MTTWTLIVGWTLLHFVWQGTLLAAVAAFGLTLFRNATPESRYTLASITLALMLVSPIITATWLSSSRPLSSSDGATAVTPTRLADTNSGVVTPDIRTASLPGSRLSRSAVTRERVFAAIVSMWLSGVLLLSIRLLGAWWHARRLQHIGLMMPASEWQAVSDRIAVRLKVRRHVHVVQRSGIEVPSVVGWWRPVLLLPLTGLAGLTPAQAEAIVAHELVHVRRHDYLVNLLQRVTETVLFYHPAVWWMSRRMRIEREHCCDAVVVRTCGDAREYALALVRLEEARAVDRPALAVAASGGALVERIRRILNPPPDNRQALSPAVVTAVALLVSLLFVSSVYKRSRTTLEARA